MCHNLSSTTTQVILDLHRGPYAKIYDAKQLLGDMEKYPVGNQHIHDV